MNALIDSFNQKELMPRDNRLLLEWSELDELCSKRKAENPRRPSISYVIRRKNVQGLPTEYEIWYRCKSIVGVQDTKKPREPIYGYLHKMRIELPHAYPAADGSPKFTFITDIWHPNIRFSGSFKGRVCLTIKEMGVLASLKTLVLRVEKYLKWQLYHALNTYPYPEDISVAEWVREEGEPNGWTHFGQDMNELPQQAKNAQNVTTTQTTPPKPKITII